MSKGISILAKKEHKYSGFTLIELAVSVGIMGVIFLFGSSMLMSAIQISTALQTQTYLVLDSVAFQDYFRSTLDNSGGGSVRPWHAVWVENNCGARNLMPGCNGTDRLSVASIVDESHICAVQSATSTTAIVELVSGVCCLDGKDFAGKQVIISTEAASIQARVTSVTTGAPCRFNYSQGQMVARSFSAGVDWSEAEVTKVQVVTIFYDPATNRLRQFEDSNGNTDADASEIRDLAVNVRDFQVALGYDINPTDGLVLSDNSQNDEWLGNHAADAMGSGGLALAENQFLRSIDVRLILTEANDTAIPITTQLLDGPQRSLTGVRSTFVQSIVNFRSTYLFQ